MNKIDKVIFLGVIALGVIAFILFVFRFIYNVITAEEKIDSQDVI